MLCNSFCQRSIKTDTEMFKAALYNPFSIRHMGRQVFKMWWHEAFPDVVRIVAKWTVWLDNAVFEKQFFDRSSFFPVESSRRNSASHWIWKTSQSCWQIKTAVHWSNNNRNSKSWKYRYDSLRSAVNSNLWWFLKLETSGRLLNVLALLLIRLFWLG